MAANGNGPAAGGDTKAVFAQIYHKLKEELLADPAFEFTTESRQWIDRVTISLPPTSRLPFFLWMVPPCLMVLPELNACAFLTG
jgi:hypothetical protein